MDNSQDKFVINLLIGKQTHSITVRRDQEEIYRKAAQMINNKLGRYEQSYPNLGYDRYKSVALLDFAVQVIQYQNEKDDTLYQDTLERLSQDLQQLLSAQSE